MPSAIRIRPRADVPVGRRYPPLISIDHVLTRGPITATAVGTLELRGTDHLAVLATLVIAPGPLIR